MQEFFVPRESFSAFLSEVREIVVKDLNRETLVTLLNVTVRFVQRDRVSALPYARHESGVFAFVFYYRIRRLTEADELLRGYHEVCREHHPLSSRPPPIRVVTTMTCDSGSRAQHCSSGAPSTSLIGITIRTRSSSRPTRTCLCSAPGKFTTTRPLRSSSIFGGIATGRASPRFPPAFCLRFP